MIVHFCIKESKDTFLYITAADGSTGETYSKLLRHKVGNNQADDEVIYTSPHPKVSMSLNQVNKNETFIIESDSRDRTHSIFLFDIKTKQKFN